MEEEQPLEPIAVTAIAPYAKSSIAFRDAVYKHPSIVWVTVEDALPGGDMDIRVSGMEPGSRLRVRGDAEHAWTALLTCEEAGRFTVTEVAASPPATPPAC